MIKPRFLLDTNFCIDLLVGRTSVGAARVEQCVDGELVTSSIAYAEVMIGARQRGQAEVAEALFRQVPVMPFEQRTANVYAQLPFKRGNFDRWIAAHAIDLDLVLVTGNESDFAGIPGLKIENWTK